MLLNIPCEVTVRPRVIIGQRLEISALLDDQFSEFFGDREIVEAACEAVLSIERACLCHDFEIEQDCRLDTLPDQKKLLVKEQVNHRVKGTDHHSQHTECHEDAEDRALYDEVKFGLFLLVSTHLCIFYVVNSFFVCRVFLR